MATKSYDKRALERFESRQQLKNKAEQRKKEMDEEAAIQRHNMLIAELQKRHQSLTASPPNSTFAVGDIVQWKAGMRNRPFPPTAKLMIVTETGLDHWMDGMASEHCQIKVGLLLPDQLQPESILQFVEVPIDHRRVERAYLPGKKATTNNVPRFEGESLDETAKG